MKILFLDIDGVVNCHSTTQRHRGYIGIDPLMALMVGRITLAIPDLKVVLSSSWRALPEGRDEVRRQVVDFIDVTPKPWYVQETSHHSTRGEEIQKWLDAHPEVTQYAILDDDSRILDNQQPNFFRTTFVTGITQEIIDQVIAHFK